MQAVAAMKNIHKIEEVLRDIEQNFIFQQHFSVFQLLIDVDSVKTGTIQPLCNLIGLDWQNKNFFKIARDFMKATPEDLLNAIKELGQGELAEHHILRHMDISHGQFCQLRKILVEECRLIVTHPNRRAHYLIAAETVQDAKSNTNTTSKTRG